MLGITGCLLHELVGVDALYPTGGVRRQRRASLAGARASVAGARWRRRASRVARSRAAAGLQLRRVAAPRPSRPLRNYAPPARGRRASESIKERTQSAIEQVVRALRDAPDPAARADRARRRPHLRRDRVARRARADLQASLSFQVGDAAFGSFEGFSGGGVDLKEWTMRAASATGGLAMDALASPWRAVLGLLSLLPQLAGYVFFDLLPQAAALAVALAWNYPEQAAGVTITTAAVLWLRWLYNWWRRPRHATTGTQSPTQATYHCRPRRRRAAAAGAGG